MNRSWDDVARGAHPSAYLDPLVARQKRAVHLQLIERWFSGHHIGTVLKTDLFEEAFGDDQLLAGLAPASRTVGIDISVPTVAAARDRFRSPGVCFLASDVRDLSFRSDSFDLVFSNSTLDHFATLGELRASLGELVRVLRPGGALVVTLDNPWNPLYPLLRQVMRLNRAPFPLGRTASRPQLCAWLEQLGMETLDHAWLIHNPRLLSTFLFMALRTLLGKTADGPISLLLGAFGLLGELPTRPFTACFVAVYARKSEIRASTTESSTTMHIQAPVTVTAIVPVLNGALSLPRCLDALCASGIPNLECVVVDDGSTDGSEQIAAMKGVSVVRTGENSGPAVARNLGAARASGDLLVFIDSDVCVHPDTLSRIVARFEAEPDLDALIGSYDDSPDAPGFVSQYKNLQNHYFHQIGDPDAVTFWSACGAIRRNVFVAVGGFDTSYRLPSIEDIELGARLRQDGHRIALDRTVFAKHLKRWTLGQLLRSDIFERALPWTQLILQSGRLPNALNVSVRQRIAALLVWASAALVAASWYSPRLLVPAAVAAAGAVAANRRFFSTLARKLGWKRAVMGLALYFSYYLYSSVAFAAGLLLHVIGHPVSAARVTEAARLRKISRVFDESK